ncbi:hypothetical protein LTR62_002093 [Meristemomyces frigidus]|uniref:CSD domain-containing protein n=1 Tax=Meristemomyces frigidus TaxID=1508187 RepID=A0AAN7YQE4_9PEZI|nr:hypothetical protein LTR62_002093 [Meristemomyces frigidus]
MDDVVEEIVLYPQAQYVRKRPDLATRFMRGALYNAEKAKESLAEDVAETFRLYGKVAGDVDMFGLIASVGFEHSRTLAQVTKMYQKIADALLTPYSIPEEEEDQSISGKVTLRSTGEVKWFSASKGYGLIKPQAGQAYGASVFDESPEQMQPGQPVTYEAVEGPRGAQAVNVRKADRLTQSCADQTSISAVITLQGRLSYDRREARRSEEEFGGGDVKHCLAQLAFLIGAEELAEELGYEPSQTSELAIASHSETHRTAEVLDESDDGDYRLHDRFVGARCEEVEDSEEEELVQVRFLDYPQTRILQDARKLLLERCRGTSNIWLSSS